LADEARRPLIAVTGPNRGAAAPRVLVALGIALAGGRAVQLRPLEPEPPQPYQGVVITGGHDVDPVLYAEESEVVPHYDPDRDAFESAVIDDAIRAGVPLLGICRGAQLLNVRLGGNLHQDLGQLRRHTSNRRTILPLKTLLVEEGSRLYGLLGAARTKINSLHHQAIDRLGDGLRIAGRDLDGIVQAIEHEERDFVVGVQWHPEFLLPLPRQRRLFDQLVESAAALDAGVSAGLRGVRGRWRTGT
jgi:putative glutamine amidotransferase